MHKLVISRESPQERKNIEAFALSVARKWGIDTLKDLAKRVWSTQSWASLADEYENDPNQFKQYAKSFYLGLGEEENPKDRPKVPFADFFGWALAMILDSLDWIEERRQIQDKYRRKPR